MVGHGGAFHYVYPYGLTGSLIITPSVMARPYPKKMLMRGSRHFYINR